MTNWPLISVSIDTSTSRVTSRVVPSRVGTRARTVRCTRVLGLTFFSSYRTGTLPVLSLFLTGFGGGPSEVLTEIVAPGTGWPSFVIVTDVSVIAHARLDQASTTSAAMNPVSLCIPPPCERKTSATRMPSPCNLARASDQDRRLHKSQISDTAKSGAAEFAIRV